MKISSKTLAVFILLAVLGYGIWYKFEYPRFLFIDLSVDKKEAMAMSESYLRSLGVNVKEYREAIVFENDDWADRYLQKTIGPAKEDKFLEKENFDLFYWHVRFFKELEKEEYSLKISAKTGNIISFEHSIEDIAPREAIALDAARQRAEEFLKKEQRFNPQQYDFHKEEAKRYDFRTDYSFSWEKKGVYIPWGNAEGGAKVLSGVTISGKEIRAFYVNVLDIPEKFKRYIDKQLIFGAYISSISFILFFAFIVISIYIVLKKRYTFIVRICKKPVLYLAAFLALINLVYLVNNMQDLFMDYPTSVNMVSYMWLYILKLFIGIIFLSVAFIFPALAGESLLNEELPAIRRDSLSHYIKSTIYGRGMSLSIAFGYILFFIVLGLQALLFYFGQSYFGVWREWNSLVRFSSACIPFLAGLILGVNASLNEEIIFRLFGISLGKKYFKNIILAIIFSSLVWGLGHSGYAIFPVWFRGLEVTILGLFFGFVFVKYGLIPVVVAHYLFDAFLVSAAYILGRSSPYLFLGSLAILILPLLFAAMAYLMNRAEEEKEINIMLDRVQKFNLEVLLVFVSAKKAQGADSGAIRKELKDHSWDMDLVDLAIKEAFRY